MGGCGLDSSGLDRDLWQTLVNKTMEPQVAQSS
jgi:hypothetical protein